MPIAILPDLHSNPKNTHNYIGPFYEEQAGLKGKIVHLDDDPTLVILFEDEPPRDRMVIDYL